MTTEFCATVLVTPVRPREHMSIGGALGPICSSNVMALLLYLCSQSRVQWLCWPCNVLGANTLFISLLKMQMNAIYLCIHFCLCVFRGSTH